MYTISRLHHRNTFRGRSCLSVIHLPFVALIRVLNSQTLRVNFNQFLITKRKLHLYRNRQPEPAHHLDPTSNRHLPILICIWTSDDRGTTLYMSTTIMVRRVTHMLLTTFSDFKTGKQFWILTQTLGVQRSTKEVSETPITLCDHHKTPWSTTQNTITYCYRCKRLCEMTRTSLPDQNVALSTPYSAHQTLKSLNLQWTLRKAMVGDVNAIIKNQWLPTSHGINVYVIRYNWAHMIRYNHKLV